MKRGKPISDAITEHRKKASPLDFLSPACRLRPAAPCVAVTIEEIYEDDTGEEFLDETELMEPDKDLGNDASSRIPNYGRPATAVPNLLLTASAVLSALHLKKQKNAE